MAQSLRNYIVISSCNHSKIMSIDVQSPRRSSNYSVICINKYQGPPNNLKQLLGRTNSSSRMRITLGWVQTYAWSYIVHIHRLLQNLKLWNRKRFRIRTVNLAVLNWRLGVMTPFRTRFKILSKSKDDPCTLHDYCHPSPPRAAVLFSMDCDPQEIVGKFKQ